MCVCGCVCVVGEVKYLQLHPCLEPTSLNVFDLTLMSVQTSVESHCSFPVVTKKQSREVGAADAGEKGAE